MSQLWCNTAVACLLYSIKVRRLLKKWETLWKLLDGIIWYRVGLYWDSEGKGYLNINNERIELQSMDYISSQVKQIKDYFIKPDYNTTCYVILRPSFQCDPTDCLFFSGIDKILMYKPLTQVCSVLSKDHKNYEIHSSIYIKLIDEDIISFRWRCWKFTDTKTDVDSPLNLNTKAKFKDLLKRNADISSATDQDLKYTFTSMKTHINTNDHKPISLKLAEPQGISMPALQWTGMKYTYYHSSGTCHLKHIENVQFFLS